MAERGRPFEPGNKLGRGRPKGSRNKKTVFVQELLDRYSLPLTRTGLAKALQGDFKYWKACMEQISPVRRDSPVNIGKLSLRTVADVSKASEIVTQKVATGQITPTEGKALAELLEFRRRSIETEDLDQRLRALEGQPCST